MREGEGARPGGARGRARPSGRAVFEAVAGLVKSASHRAEEYTALRARERAVPTAYAQADLRISPSRFLRDKYLEHAHLVEGGFDPHTFLFSDNGMRTDHVEALAKAPDAAGKVRFGFVGSLVWYKGGEVLVEAMRALLRARGLGDRAHLNVYGGFDPENDDHHRRLAELAEDAPSPSTVASTTRGSPRSTRRSTCWSCRASGTRTHRSRSTRRS